MRHLRWSIGVVVLALGTAAPAQTVGGGVAPPCDRTCMTGLVDRYLDALVRHDATGLPLNRDVRFTENTARLEVGSEGLWVTASEAPTGPRIYAIDIGAGQAGFYGVMKERGRPLIIALRLKVVNGQITEIEHVLARTVREDALRHVMTPRLELAADVTPVDSLPLGGATSNLQAGEIFKIDRGGQITAIEAMGAQLPYGTPSGWGE